MRIERTELEGVLVLHPEVHTDDRGYFFESYKQSTFKDLRLNTSFVQENESFSKRGVVRGLHYQAAPYAQAKLVRAVAGEIVDVAVDIRKGSPTFGRYVAVRLSGVNHAMLYIPRGFAHGFSVVSEWAIVQYRCDGEWHRDAERGIRYDDPDIGVDWQVAPGDVVLSEKDRQHPYLRNLD